MRETAQSPNQGYNRWMVPPAALCVHLSIGQAYAFTVFNLPMTKLVGIAPIGARRLAICRRWAEIFSSPFSCSVSPPPSSAAGSRRRSAPREIYGRPMLGRRLSIPATRRLRPQHLGRLSRLWPGWRLRTWHRLHLAGLDPDQMVSGSSRHGDRHGDHGLRRRRLHCLPLSVWLMSEFSTSTHIGVAETFLGDGRDLSGVA